jgi:chromosomal replication initiator protein
MDGLRDWMLVNAIETRQRRLTMGLIVRVTAETYDVALKDLLSSRRTHKFIEPREVAMYLCRVLTDYSFPQIGRTLHRDHTSVLAGFRRVGRRILDNPDFAARVEQIASAVAALVRESEAAS